MMESKLWIALCALLLLVNSGSAEHGEDHAAASQSDLGAKVVTEAPATGSVPATSLEPSSHPALALNGSDTNSSPNGTSSLSSNATKDGETTSLTPEQKKNNDTAIPPSVSDAPQNNANLTEESTTQPPVLPSESHTSPSHVPTTTHSTTSPLHTAHTAPADTATTHATNYSAPPLPPDLTSPSEQPTHAQTHSWTSTPTPEPPRSETTTNTITSTSPSSTSSTSSSREPPHSESQTLTPPHAPRSDGPQDQPKSTVTPPSPSAHAKAHADNPSQLNVGGDTTMVHESPTLDPLLAGLVSAFIITAVIITLLLFLKLRRRDNRPEFRRLQDLPMDDMMEDTPLSMYSY